MHDDTVSRQSLHDRLVPYHQEDVLRFWDELNSDGRAQLADQLTQLDLGQLATLLAGNDTKQDFAAMADRAMSPPSVRADGTGAAWTLADAIKQGEAALAAGEVGAILVAGGQGTRLGFDQPKGMFPIGPVSNRTLFQFFADRLIAIGERYSVQIPWYIMTSDATDAETREYFDSNNYLRLDPTQIRIFKQGVMPAVDTATGKLLLASKDSLALSPDGHGGTVAALDRNGCLDDAEKRGVQYLAYFQVDNPLANLCDPVLIGHHVMAASEMTTQVVRKRYPTEKVGNVALVDGRMQIIEYSDLPESAAHAKTADGQLKLWAGNIAVHVINVDFLRTMSRSAEALPFHRAAKKVPFVDHAGKQIEPTDPNATKFERFIFDLLPLAENAFVVESLPSEAFAPVKNAEGAPTDTASLARSAVSDLHKRWLIEAGATVADGVSVEINPRFAMSTNELKKKIPGDLKVESDRYFDI